MMIFDLVKTYKVLFIGLVWPEPTSSAAGRRILQLVKLFKDDGHEVIFSSAAQKTESSFDLSQWHVREEAIELNKSSFDDVIRAMQPDMVVFDRYITEEQFGWRVAQTCPQALKILDTEDLHFLRLAREKAYAKNQEVDLYNKTTYREIASILRSDLSLIISSYEMDVLRQGFNISDSILYDLPFTEDLSGWNEELLPDYDERRDFVFIGNYLHKPNRQAVFELKNEIWPKLSKVLPDTKLHIYGAYADDRMKNLHSDRDRFHFHGKAEDAITVLSDMRLMLAPLRFGAGQKGKFIDAMYAGLPLVTTTIGAEGMFSLGVPGKVTDDVDEFIASAVDLYNDKTKWQSAQKIGFQIMKETFDKSWHDGAFYSKISKVFDNLEHHRKSNYFGKILLQNASNALKYMSLWIEEKNKNEAKGQE